MPFPIKLWVPSTSISKTSSAGIDSILLILSHLVFLPSDTAISCPALIAITFFHTPPLDTDGRGAYNVVNDILPIPRIAGFFQIKYTWSPSAQTPNCRDMRGNECFYLFLCRHISTIPNNRCRRKQ